MYPPLTAEPDFGIPSVGCLAPCGEGAEADAQPVQTGIKIGAEWWFGDPGGNVGDTIGLLPQTKIKKVPEVFGALRDLVFSRRVYRVEAKVNKRLDISSDGDVEILDGGMLFLNVGNKRRAKQYLKQKHGIPGTEDAVIKSFRVKRSFLRDLRRTSVDERLAESFPTHPIKVDRRWRGQYGLRPGSLPGLRDHIVRGSGRVHQP